MKKKKNIFSILISCFSLIEAVFIVLVSVGILKLWLFFVLFGVCAVPIAIFSILIAKLKKKIKLSKLKAKNDIKTLGNYMLDVYTLLGIDPLYDKDGKLVDLYDILKIKPIFDDQGNRVLTVYEMLGVTPLFDKEGKEVPVVFAIKNRVGKIAKVRLSTEFLTRKLTPEEEEERLIQEMLKKKLEEAEKSGDAKKVKAIGKVIKNSGKSDKGKKKAPATVSFVGVKVKTKSESKSNKKKDDKNKKKGEKKFDPFSVFAGSSKGGESPEKTDGTGEAKTGGAKTTPEFDGFMKIPGSCCFDKDKNNEGIEMER